ncbi:MAG: DUF4249 domain-containing protein [Saprospiraceae bacterium]|nr:DUF4249 domain-containing protein [Saprospiraceae bacterium]
MRVLSFILFTILLVSCEEEFTPDVISAPPEVVVEGYVEASDLSIPVFVILRNNFPFFSELGPAQLADAYIHDAEVLVRHNGQETQLAEACLSDLPDEIADAIVSNLIADIDTFELCLYIDLAFQIPRVEGGRYDLEVQVEDKRLSATTTIPEHVPLDSLQFVEPPGNPNDTLAQMRIFISDPAEVANFYQYNTQINLEQLQKPFASVTDDRLFDGQSFQFPLQKAERSIDATEIDPVTFGLFRVGDDVTIRWMNIDEAHFNFWNTLEFNIANQGPFSSYTRVQSNIEGGLGIWGGISASYYRLEVAK